MTSLIDPNVVKYPHIDSIIRLKPNPHILLGKDIVWTEKRDGSNFGVYLTEDGWSARTRGMTVASDQFMNYFKQTPECGNVIELLKSAVEWDDTYMVFGELLSKGKSPTKIEYHDDYKFVVFDIWSEKLGGFMNYTKVYQECTHYNLPIVECYGTSRSSTLEHLLEFRDHLLRLSKERGREGVVGKTWDGSESIYFKEKNDTPKYEKLPNSIDESKKIVLPPLPYSEVTGAIEKARADLGDDFKDVRIAMAKIAEYVQIEQKKHNCGKPERKLFDLYKERLEELARVGE